MREREGFTLIELLIVISIISLLIAILLPALTQARETASRIKCLTGTRQAAIAVEGYMNDFDEFYPRGSNSNPYHVLFVQGDYAAENLFTNKGGCPHGPVTFRPQAGSAWTDPATPYVTYGLNPILQGGHGQTHPYVAPHWKKHGTFRRTDHRIVRHAPNTPVFIDSVTAWAAANGNVEAIVGLQGALAAWWNVENSPGIRHMGAGVNASFADGHGEWIDRELAIGHGYFWPVGSRMWGFKWKNADPGLDY